MTSYERTDEEILRACGLDGERIRLGWSHRIARGMRTMLQGMNGMMTFEEAYQYAMRSRWLSLSEGSLMISGMSRLGVVEGSRD